MARTESPRFSSPAETLEAPKLELMVERKIASEAAIVYGAWGRPLGNEELLAEYIKASGITDDKEIKEAEDLVKGTGITTRHISEGDKTIFEIREQVAQEMIDIGAELTQRAVQMNGWDPKEVDFFYVTSSVPPDEISLNDPENWVRIMARKLGIPESAEKKLFYLACGGSGAAFLEALKRPELADQKVVITSVEALSYGVRYHPTTTDELAAAAIFGNGAASFAFTPEQFELYYGVTKIVPDKDEVIRCPRLYKLPHESLRRKPPEWYQADAVSPKIFAYTDSEVVMMLPAPRGDPSYAEMDGRPTAKFFTKHVPPVALEATEKSGVEVVLGVFHQASEGVLILGGNSLNRKLRGLGMPEMKIPWVMDEVGMGNVSSASTLIALAELSKRGEINNQPFNLTSFGVGAAITSMVVRTKS